MQALWHAVHLQQLPMVPVPARLARPFAAAQTAFFLAGGAWLVARLADLVEPWGLGEGTALIICTSIAGRELSFRSSKVPTDVYHRLCGNSCRAATAREAHLLWACSGLTRSWGLREGTALIICTPIASHRLHVVVFACLCVATGHGASPAGLFVLRSTHYICGMRAGNDFGAW